MPWSKRRKAIHHLFPPRSNRLPSFFLATAVLAWAAPTPAQQVYRGVDGQISLMIYHTRSDVTANWVCTSASGALDVDGSGVVENDECYASGPRNWPNFDGFCGLGAVNSSLELQSLTGDKPGRKGDFIYHLVQAANFTPGFGGIPDSGPGRMSGDNFVLFRCPLADPNCKRTAPVLINAALRPDNEPCAGEPLTDPSCNRYNWQLKATNEFPPEYRKLEVWAKLQNSGVRFIHDDAAATGQLPGTREVFFKDAVVVVNRTNTTVPFSSPVQRQWNGPFQPQSPGRGWENALVWYMDNRWCDGSFGFSVPGGCPTSTPLEARLIDIQIERRVFATRLPDLTDAPDSGRCTVGIDCDLVATTADGVGFLNFGVDGDREFLAANGGLCVDTVNGGVIACADPTIPASCADRSNTSPECLPVTGCNCCEPTNVNTCKNRYVRNQSAYLIMDARNAFFFPEYDPGGRAIVGWAWVKWGKVLTEIPPLHPGVNRRILEVNAATVPDGPREWQFWQIRGAGSLATDPLPLAACDQSTTSTAVPLAPFTTHDQISTLTAQQQDAWDCNVGTTDLTALRGKGRVLGYGTFDPETGVITTTPAATDAELRLPAYTHAHMPTWYPQGIRWLAGYLEVRDHTGEVAYRSIAWGGVPQMACNVANTGFFKIPGRAILYEEIEFPGE